MADRYWVGGSGTWTTGGTTKWSTTSGGPSGASVPTAADNAIFNTGSNAGGYTVTIGAGAVCFNLSLGVPSGGGVINIAGNQPLACVGTTVFFNGTSTWTGTGQLQLSVASPNTCTFTPMFGSMNGGVTQNGTGNVSLAGALTTINNVTINRTFTTNGFAVTSATFSAISAGTGTLNFSSSVVTTGTMSFGDTGQSVTGTTGTIVFNNTFNATLNFRNSTIPNLTWPATTSGVIFLQGTGTTITNFTITPVALNTDGKAIFLRSATITITNFTHNPATVGPFRLLMVGQSLQGTLYDTATITNTTATMSAIDFAYISFNTLKTGTSLGNITNNSNITFPAARTVYWNVATGGAFRSTSWALTPGGAVSDANYPLPQDTWQIVDTGLNSGATITTTNNSGYAVFPSVNAAPRTLACTVNRSSNTVYLGRNNVWNALVTLSGSGATFESLGTVSFNSGSAANSIAGNLRASAGTLTLTGNSAVFNSNFFLTNDGGIDLNNLILTCGLVGTSGTILTNARINFRATGEINSFTTTGVIWNQTNITVSGTGKRIVRSTANFSGTRTFTAGVEGSFDLTCVSLYLTWGASGGANIVNIQPLSQNYFNDLICTGPAGTILGVAGTSNLVNLFGDLNIPSTITSSTTSNVILYGATNSVVNVGGNRTWNFYPYFKNSGVIVTLQAAFTSDKFGFQPFRFNQNGFTVTAGSVFIPPVAANATYTSGGGVINVVLSNTNIFNGQNENRPVVNDSMTINSTYTGAVGTRTILGIPTGSSYLEKITLNVTGGTDILNVQGTSGNNGILGLNLTGFNGTVTTTENGTIRNNLTLDSTLGNYTGWTGVLNVGSFTGTKTFTLNGRTLSNSNVSVSNSSAGGILAFATNGTCNSLTLTNGTVSLGTSTITLTNGFSSIAGIVPRVIALGNGVLNIPNGLFNNTSNTTFSCTGTSTGTIQMGNGTTFNGASATYFGVSFTGSCTITGANTFTNFGNTLASRTITLPASTTTTVTNFNLNGTAGNLTSLVSSSLGTQATISKSSGTVNANYLNIRDSNATGGAVWNALNSINSGNNLGWIFAVVINFLAAAFFTFF